MLIGKDGFGVKKNHHSKGIEGDTDRQRKRELSTEAVWNSNTVTYMHRGHW